MITQRPLSILVTSAALCALSACESLPVLGTSTTAPSATSSSSTAQASAPTPASASKATPEGLDYVALGQLLEGPEKQVRQDVVGKLVSLDLAKAQGRSAPAGVYVVNGADAVFFRCKTTQGGFAGGEVTAKITGYRYVAKGEQKTLELDRCAAPVVAEAPKATAPAPVAAASGSAKPGMDARGNVIDASKVEAGSGRTVKGINDYEGEITGNPAPGSKFTRLQIGMSMKQATDIAGPPTDQGAYVTGKAWIPFYFGGDRHRYEMAYKGQGRLIFAGGSLGDMASGHLIWIIHSASESGYR